MVKKLFKSFARWLPLGLTIFVLCFFSFVAAQQNLRQGANDPQIELSQNVADSIMSGNKPSLPVSKVDISKSLSLYVIIYNEKKQVVYSTPQINGLDVRPPEGVLDSAKTKGSNRVTWQPAPKVRQAIVVQYFNKGKIVGYVVVGRSLKEVESRIDNLTKIFFTTLGFALVGSYLIKFILINLHL